MSGLGDIGSAMIYLATVIGSCTAIFTAVKKSIKNLFDVQTKDIREEMKNQNEAIVRVDLENCKNYLVTFLARLERDDSTIDEIEKQRFWEQFEHYGAIGGNSYVANKVSKLKAAGKL